MLVCETDAASNVLQVFLNIQRCDSTAAAGLAALCLQADGGLELKHMDVVTPPPSPPPPASCPETELLGSIFYFIFFFSSTG